MRPMSFALFRAEILSLYEPPFRAKGTYRQMDQVMREFALLPCVKTVRDLRPTAIVAWSKAHPERTPARTASLLRSLASACSYAMAEGYLERSPFGFRSVNQWVRDQVVAPERPREHRHQSREAVERLLALVDREAAEGSWKAGRLQALVYTLAFTGMRKGEVLHLKTCDVDLAGRTIVIVPRKTFRPKTRKSAAAIPLAPPLVDVLARWAPRTGCEWLFPGVERAGPWLSGCPGYKALDEVKAVGQRAGIDGLTIAGFRKTLGTLAKSWGLGQLEVKALLRHSNVETQRWYDEETVESLRGAVDKIPFRAAATGGA